jgi:HSP20 family protein
LDGLREGVLSAFDRWLPKRRKSDHANGEGTWLTSHLWREWPTIDVADTDNEVVVTAELPGLEPKDFKVELEGDHLILHGEKRASHEEKDRTHYYSESTYGSFHRAIPLPCEIKADKVEAQHKDGVLRIHLPKTEEAKARRVRIEVK